MREEYDSNDDVDSVDSDGEEFNSESDNVSRLITSNWKHEHYYDCH